MPGSSYDKQHADIVRQRIRMEPLDRNVVFSVYPPALDLPERSRVRLDKRRAHLFLQSRYRGTSDQISLVVHTAGFKNGVANKITPRLRTTTGALIPIPGEPQMARIPESVAGRLSGTIELAQKIVDDAEIAPKDRLGKARAILGYLRDSGEYSYSLDNAEPNGDPIEDFVTRRRSGHCEYFASALALMLRSQGVPSRVVIGFRGGEWNSLGSFYQVRQLHAHAWVEVLLRHDDLPDDLRRSDDFSGGAWLTLDPTPDDPSVLSSYAGGSVWGRMREFYDYVQQMWTAYVVDMTSRRQSRTFYDPVRERLDAIAGWWRQFTGQGTTTVIDDEPPPDSGGYGWWVTSLVVGAFAIIGVVAWRRWMNRRVPAHRSRNGRPDASPPPEVPFYRKLERILAKHGIRRAHGQTPREFAVVAGSQLRELDGGAQIAGLPRQIVDAFYKVRFGGRPLDEQQTADIQSVLHAIENPIHGTASAERKR